MSRHSRNRHEAFYWQDPALPTIKPVEVQTEAPVKPWFVVAQEQAQLAKARKPAPLALRPCMAIVVYEPPVKIDIPAPKPAVVETPADYPTLIGATVQVRGVAQGVVTGFEGDWYTVWCAFPGCVVHRKLSELAVLS